MAYGLLVRSSTEDLFGRNDPNKASLWLMDTA